MMAEQDGWLRGQAFIPHVERAPEPDPNLHHRKEAGGHDFRVDRLPPIAFGVKQRAFAAERACTSEKTSARSR